MSDPYLRGLDAAYSDNIPADWRGVVLGYLGGPNALHRWMPSDWRRFDHNLKIPIWVGGLNGEEEGWQALQSLFLLGVPRGHVVILDLETRIDRTYVSAFGSILQWAGFLVWVYGSTSTLFANPELNGYAVADPTGTEHMYSHPGVRMTQWAFGSGTDADAIKQWVGDQGQLWR